MKGEMSSAPPMASLGFGRVASPTTKRANIVIAGSATTGPIPLRLSDAAHPTMLQGSDSRARKG